MSLEMIMERGSFKLHRWIKVTCLCTISVILCLIGSLLIMLSTLKQIPFLRTEALIVTGVAAFIISLGTTIATIFFCMHRLFVDFRQESLDIIEVSERPQIVSTPSIYTIYVKDSSKLTPNQEREVTKKNEGKGCSKFVRLQSDLKYHSYINLSSQNRVEVKTHTNPSPGRGLDFLASGYLPEARKLIETKGIAELSSSLYGLSCDYMLYDAQQTEQLNYHLLDLKQQPYCVSTKHFTIPKSEYLETSYSCKIPSPQIIHSNSSSRIDIMQACHNHSSIQETKYLCTSPMPSHTCQRVASFCSIGHTLPLCDTAGLPNRKKNVSLTNARGLLSSKMKKNSLLDISEPSNTKTKKASLTYKHKYDDDDYIPYDPEEPGNVDCHTVDQQELTPPSYPAPSPQMMFTNAEYMEMASNM